MNEQHSLTTSDDADRTCLALLHAVRTGDARGFARAVGELERLYTYAHTAPSRTGFRNLLHILRVLHVSHFHSWAEGERAIPNLVAIEEGATYDPDTRLVADQIGAERALNELNAKGDADGPASDAGPDPGRPKGRRSRRRPAGDR